MINVLKIKCGLLPESRHSSHRWRNKPGVGGLWSNLFNNISFLRNEAEGYTHVLSCRLMVSGFTRVCVQINNSQIFHTECLDGFKQFVHILKSFNQYK